MITNFIDNSGGLNISDSPLFMKDNQATGQSYNYDYLVTGAVSKVLSPTLLNLVADSNLKTLGLGQHHDVTTNVRTAIRCAGINIQKLDTTTGVRTNLSDDTVSAKTSFLSTTSTQPVVFSPFNTLSGGTQLWMAGGGLGLPVGYNGTKITTNGVTVPTGSIGVTINTHSGGSFSGAGKWYYGVQFRKKSTQAYSNVALDILATTVNVDDTVTLDLTTVTNIDSTLYDQITVWRSAFNGSTGFTTGSIIAQLAPTVTTYTDTGASIADSQNTPRSGNVVLDNSVLPTGTYPVMTAFKRRLVVAKGSTIYLADLNKPESWPLTNVITLPTGGPITAVGVIGVPSEYTTGADEYLCIWKDSELWVLTGGSIDDWTLLFVDKTGCAGQGLVVSFNSFVSWMTYNGIFIWDGRGRPTRVSRPIASLFNADGDIDKARLSQGCSVQYEQGQQIIWRVSHRTKGVNKLSIKLDIRLTMQTAMFAQKSLAVPELDGVFLFDTDSNSYYSLCSFKTANKTEMILSGDDQGYVYSMYASASNPVAFDYETKPLDMGHPERMKRFKRVLVYVEKLTDNDLSMYFWTDYRIRDEYRSVTKASLAPAKGTQPALFDVALFDQAYFDDYTPDIAPIEFNIHNYENNSEGLSLKLRFEQLEASAPVRIHGFSVEWEDASNIPLPTAQVG